MNESITKLIAKIEEKDFQPSIDLDRPIYFQPEDRIKYRSARIILILGMFNTKRGLSKKVIACMDFLLRNTGFQSKFVIEYFKNEQVLYKKLGKCSTFENIENDFNIVRYKSVPWDLRFNDMFLYLKTRKLIEFKGEKETLRFFLSGEGKKYYEQLREIFLTEVNFLELFGKSLSQDKVVKIITEIIPNTYWRENEKLICE
jgi:hypothetical protein